MSGVAKSILPGVTSRPIVPATQWTLLPARKLAVGVNLDGTQTLTNAYYAEFWTQWPWASYIKPQIDAAAAFGFNQIRFICSTLCRFGSSGYAPQLDTQTYLNQMRQMLAYIRAKGMYAYPNLGGDSDANAIGGYGYTPAASWFAGELATVAQLLAQHADIVVGVDLLGEATAWANVGTRGATVYNAVKAVAPNLSLTWSSIAGDTAAPNAGTFDHLDQHIYLDGLAANYLDSTLAAAGVPLMVGEFGATVGSGDRPSRYTEIGAIAEFSSGGRRVAGVEVWDAIPSIAGPNNDYGFFDSSNLPRTDVAPIVAGYPTIS